MGTKDYSLQYDDRDGFLHVVVTGRKDSLAVTMAALTAIAAECRKRKTAKILVEHRIPGVLTMTEMFEIGEKIPDLFRGVLTAFVLPTPSAPNLAPFTETVAKNRGATGRLCTTVAEAEEWLASV